MKKSNKYSDIARMLTFAALLTLLTFNSAYSVNMNYAKSYEDECCAAELNSYGRPNFSSMKSMNTGLSMSDLLRNYNAAPVKGLLSSQTASAGSEGEFTLGVTAPVKISKSRQETMLMEGYSRRLGRNVKIFSGDYNFVNQSSLTVSCGVKCFRRNFAADLGTENYPAKTMYLYGMPMLPWMSLSYTFGK